MVKWIALLIAVLANVVANISLKYLAKGNSLEMDSFKLMETLSRPSLWIGLIACVVLLLSYVYALKQVSVGVAYAIVTSFALVMITIISSFLFDDRIVLVKVIGMALIIIGIILLVGTEAQQQLPNDQS